MPLDIRERGGSPSLINFINLSLRVLQIVFSAAAVGIYASQIGILHWQPIRAKLLLAETVAVMSLVTAGIYAAIPFLISYYFVAIAFLWDWILFFIWCAVFTTLHLIFGDKRQTDLMKKAGYGGVDTMVAGQWVDLVAMLLFLLSALMGPTCLWIDRKSLRASRTIV